MTEQLIAKPIIKDQFWIVTNGHKKVGNIEANNSGYGVQLNGTHLQFHDTNELSKTIDIKFEKSLGEPNINAHPYKEFPTTPRVYNSIYDVQHGLHLYTKTKKSKCLHAAGWYMINLNGIQTISFCPKYLFIQRYEFSGPFKTENEAKNLLNS